MNDTRNQSRRAVVSGVLGTLALAGCSDGGSADPYPNIPNCPMVKPERSSTAPLRCNWRVAL